MPEELRVFFRKDHALLNYLFKAAADDIFFLFKRLNKSEILTPGFICVLRTFGRSLQWNPHIHMLISEGGIGNFSPWRVIKHFHYELLCKSFHLTLLNYLEAHFDKPFKKIKAYIFKNCPMGFMYMLNIIDAKINCFCLYQKKKDAPMLFVIHGGRLFLFLFILTHSCASAATK